MDRLHKKCLVASFGTHAFLLLLLLFGSAFFVSSKRPLDLPAIRMVPSKVVDSALSGGGGDPKIAPSEEKIKGDTITPVPAAPQPPKPAVKPVEKPAKAEPQKLALVPTVRRAAPVKPLKLTPVDTAPTEQTKSKPTDSSTAAQKELAAKVGSTAQSLRSGFDHGTAVQISGPGGEAFANYAQWVKQVYEDAWIVSDDLDDLESTAKVSIVIARNGNVISARIERRSGNPVLDKSVQRTLDKVRFVRPFPEGSTDTERTFIINFNLKAKRSIG
jgi:protein TonB